MSSDLMVNKDAEIPVSVGDAFSGSVSYGDADHPYETVVSIQTGVETLNANVVKLLDGLQVIVALVIILVTLKLTQLLYKLLDIFW